MSKVKATLDSFPPLDWRSFRPQPIVGVDEVGRGCLAGRVYAAAVVLPPDGGEFSYKDSKLLSARRREEACAEILAHYPCGIGFATVDEIDTVNILKASLLAMKRAVLELGIQSGHLLVDGNQRIPGMDGFEQTTVIKGDLRAAPIAAASIVAKVTRDQYMIELAEKFPTYGFAQHKGYSTKVHKDLIGQHGPCPEHRRTFAGVREHCL